MTCTFALVALSTWLGVTNAMRVIPRTQSGDLIGSSPCANGMARTATTRKADRQNLLAMKKSPKEAPINFKQCLAYLQNDPGRFEHGTDLDLKKGVQREESTC